MQRNFDHSDNHDGKKNEAIKDEAGWSTGDESTTSTSATAVADAGDGNLGANTQQKPNQPSTFRKRNVSLDHLLAIRDAAERFKESFKRLAPARKRAIVQRDEGLYEREQHFHLRRFFKESQDECVIQQQSQGDSGNPLALREQFEVDSGRLNTQDSRLRALELSLTDTEFRMKDREEALMQASKEMLKVLGDLGIISSTDSEDMDGSESIQTSPVSVRPPSSAIDPLLEDYYEKSGAISWRQERLAEFQTEYQEGRSIRLFRQEHDQEVDLSDEEFEAHYRRILSDAESAVQLATTQANEARIACEYAGLDPDAGRNRASESLIDLSGSPVTPDEFQPPQVNHIPFLTPGSLIKSNRTKSSALLSSQTGNLWSDLSLPVQPAEDVGGAEDRLEEWMESTIEDLYPFDDQHFEENPRLRPIDHARRSESYLMGKMSMVSRQQSRQSREQRSHSWPGLQGEEHETSYRM